jgi:hypothetical protein
VENLMKTIAFSITWVPPWTCSAAGPLDCAVIRLATRKVCGAATLPAVDASLTFRQEHRANHGHREVRDNADGDAPVPAVRGNAHCDAGGDAYDKRAAE